MLCVCVCACACVRVCVRACMRVCVRIYLELAFSIFKNTATTCKARLDRPNDSSRSAGEGLCVLLSFLFHDTNKIKWNTFSYIFCLVISSDSINEKVLMISVHH